MNVGKGDEQLQHYAIEQKSTGPNVHRNWLLLGEKYINYFQVMEIIRTIDMKSWTNKVYCLRTS